VCGYDQSFLQKRELQYSTWEQVKAWTIHVDVKTEEETERRIVLRRLRWNLEVAGTGESLYVF